MGRLWIVRQTVHVLYLVMALGNAIGSIAALTKIHNHLEGSVVTSLLVGLLTAMILVTLLVMTKQKALSLKWESGVVLGLYFMTMFMLIYRTASTTFSPFGKPQGDATTTAATVLTLLHVLFSLLDLVTMSTLFLIVTVRDKVESGWSASVWDALNGADVPLQEPEEVD